MKKRLKEMEDEAAALREMQAKVEKEMGSVQGASFFCFVIFSLQKNVYMKPLFSSFFNLENYLMGRKCCSVQ